VADRQAGLPDDNPALDSLVLGVTGHRADLLSADEIPELRCTVRKVLVAFANSVRGPITLVSSLAEGADQLVAEEALNAGYKLICPLPFPRDLYERDFTRDESVRAFRRLLDQAAEIEEHPGERATAEADLVAYANAGKRMLDRADVLLAIWNGGAARGVGGTAEIIASARERGLPVVWIHATTPRSLQILAKDEDLRVAIEDVLRNTNG
jgi:hypothetical protein